MTTMTLSAGTCSGCVSRLTASDRHQTLIAVRFYYLIQIVRTDVRRPQRQLTTVPMFHWHHYREWQRATPKEEIEEYRWWWDVEATLLVVWKPITQLFSTHTFITHNCNSSVLIFIAVSSCKPSSEFSQWHHSYNTSDVRCYNSSVFVSVFCSDHSSAWYAARQTESFHNISLQVT